MSEYFSGSDPLTGTTFDDYDTLVEQAFDSLHTIDQDSLVIAERLATVTESERAHRFRYDVTNRNLINAAREQIEDSDGAYSVPEIAMTALHDYLGEHYDQAERLHRAMGHKGIGLTLGYVEQTGSWDRIAPLDASFRQFPASPLLKQRGFRFSETYGSKDAARLSYGLKIYPSRQGQSLVGIRKRAAADITDETVTYDLVKRSVFWIDHNRLSAEEMTLAGRMLSARHNGTPSDTDIEKEFGDRVIEPYVTDENGVRASGIVLPAASSYTALRRFDK